MRFPISSSQQDNSKLSVGVESLISVVAAIHTSYYRQFHDMEALELIKADNKAVRRNGLKQLLKAIEDDNWANEMEEEQILSCLPFNDSYDTCRELSFKIVNP